MPDVSVTDIGTFFLKDARPDNQAHLLLWDTPTQAEIWQLAHFNDAERVNYRTNLLQRVNPGDRFLNLHHRLDEELDALKAICRNSTKPVVLLEGLDCLIAYLRIQKGTPLTLFWNNLEKTRKLERLLWILLPHALAPQAWKEDRICRIFS